MTDKIIIKQLHVETIIGLYAWEKKVRQTLLVDLELFTDIRKAAADDDLHHTVNYAAVCDSVSELTLNNHYNLIETLTEAIATLVLTEFSVERVNVTVKKLDNLTQVDHVGISIERP